jgi:general secretion pathway protein L
MADYLVLRLPANEEHAVEWLLVDSQGARKSAPASGTLEDAARQASDHPVIVLVPGEEVLTLPVDLPIKAGARLRAAVPFALEDNLATDIEDLHFAIGAAGDGGLWPVAVVAQSTIDGWVARLHDAGLYPARLVPDYHGVQRMPNTISLIAADHSIMVNDGADLAFMIRDLPPGDALALTGILETPADDDGDEESEPVPRHLVAWCTPDEEQRYAHDWNALRTELDSVDVNVMPDGVLPRLAATVAAGAGINLLQGPYGKRTEMAAVLRPWRLAAGLLLGVVLLGMVGKGVDYVRLVRQEAALQAQYLELYQTIRPNDGRVPADPIGTADSLTREIIGNNAGPTQVFLPSLMQLAEAIIQNREADVEAVSYRAGVIDVRLTAPDVATLDKIQKVVSDSGRFSASIQGTTQDPDGKVNSRIQIRDTGA